MSRLTHGTGAKDGGRSRKMSIKASKERFEKIQSNIDSLPEKEKLVYDINLLKKRILVCEEDLKHPNNSNNEFIIKKLNILKKELLKLQEQKNAI